MDLRSTRVIAALLLVLPLTLAAAPGERIPHARHLIVTPAAGLTEQDRAELAAEGIEMQRPLTGGRFIARVQAGVSPEDDPRVRSAAPLTIDQKVHASAWRLAAEGKPFIRVRVFFNDDVSIDDARASVLESGGALDDPLVSRFEPLSSVVVRVPSDSLARLATDDRVLVVYGARPFKASGLNATAAAASHVTEVQAAPYNLSGSGVVLTYFELGPADTAHQEFGGRLTLEFQCQGSSDTDCNDAGNKLHATHVGGTMIAAGIVSAAKGMAPSATLHEFRANDGAWLDQKDTALKALGSVADNNSWGYILGWYSENGEWVWEEGDELIGGYTGDLNAVIDHVALDNGALMVHSAGNDADTTGPTLAPFRHHHVDSSGNTTSDFYCYSQNGTGTDCPAPPTCSAGAQFCEIAQPGVIPHPTHNATVSNPGGSIGWMASSKNIVAVGSTNSSLVISTFSSRGPTRDGRVKPDLTAKGQSLYSTEPGNQYGRLQGTSMASPVVTGSMALLAQEWRLTNGGESPLPATLKALAIAGADDKGNPGPDYTYGFGFLDTRNAVDLIIADEGAGKRIRIDNANQGSVFDYPMTIVSPQNIRVVLSWFDPEVLPLGSEETAGKTLVNDLDVTVIDPSGATLFPYVLDPASPSSNATTGVNTRDNTEELEIANAVPGTYHVRVNGTNVPKGPQQFVLVANAQLALTAACTDGYEPNDTAAAAAAIATTRTISAMICGAADVDYYKFSTNLSGNIVISLTATDTPLKVTLLNGAGSAVVPPLTIAAGSSAALSATAPVGTTQYFVRVEANGGAGATGAYTLTSTYPLHVSPRRRGTRH